MIIPVVIFLVLSAACLLIFIYKRVAYFDLLNVTHEKLHILYGNAKGSSLGKWSVAYDVDRIYRKFKGQALSAGFMRNLTPYLVPLNSDVLKQILITNFKSFRNNDFGSEVKRHSIITLNPFWLRNESWKITRSELSPALSSPRLKAMYPLICEAAKELIDYITSETTSLMSLDAREISLRYSCNAIASTTYGVNAHAYETSSEILHYGERLWREISDSTTTLFPRSELISSDVNQFFVELTSRVVQSRRYHNEPRSDILSFLIALKDKRSSSSLEVAANAMTFFADGFETSSLALCYALYEISRSPRVQDKLRAEIAENCDRPMPIDTLLKLPYLDQVFYEALRLHPPIFYTTRACSEDVELTAADGSDERQLVRAGTAIWIPIHSIHRDSDFYRNPDEFLPERFDDECGGVKAFRDKCVLIPFGNGSRICLGMNLATLQVKTALVEILRNFEITCDESTSAADAKIQPNKFVNLPNGKIFIRFRKI